MKNENISLNLEKPENWVISRIIKSKMNSMIILETQKNYLKKKERCPSSFFKA